MALDILAGARQLHTDLSLQVNREHGGWQTPSGTTTAYNTLLGLAKKHYAANALIAALPEITEGTTIYESHQLAGQIMAQLEAETPMDLG